MRDGDQGAATGGPALTHRELQERREPVGDDVGEQDEDERCSAPPEERERKTETEPDEPVIAEHRQPDEDVVEGMPPVVDHPALGVPVPAGQTGAICFVCSINC